MAHTVKQVALQIHFHSSLLLLVIFSPCSIEKEIPMTVQVIPVRTTRPAQTEWTDSTAAVHQDLMEHNVKQVTATNYTTNFKRPCA